MFYKQLKEAFDILKHPHPELEKPTILLLSHSAISDLDCNKGFLSRLDIVGVDFMEPHEFVFLGDSWRDTYITATQQGAAPDGLQPPVSLSVVLRASAFRRSSTRFVPMLMARLSIIIFWLSCRCHVSHQLKLSASVAQRLKQTNSPHNKALHRTAYSRR